MNITTNNPANPAAPSEKRFGFWARLPLSRKLLVAFGVLFAFALIIAVVSLYGLNQVQAQYEETLSQGVEVRRLSAQLDIELLRARRAEKNFLLRWRTEGFDTAYANYMTLYIEAVSQMRQNIAALENFGAVAGTLSTGDYSQAQYEADIASLKQNVNTYEESVTALVDAIEKKGSTEDTGFEGEFRVAARAIEEKISGKTGLEQLEITYLQLRRAEKDYLERADSTYVDQVKKLVTQLKAQISASELIEPAQKTELRAQADAYQKAFDNLVLLDQEIAGHDAELVAAARSVEPLTVKILDLGGQLGAEKTAQAQATSNQITTFAVVIVFLALGLSILLAFTISGQLTRPILSLTNTAQEISGGKFDLQAQVQSADEIGTLAESFNIMTARLGQAFADVNRRAAELATVAEVGTATATILQTDRLLQEVVNLTKERFNLYHSHIYLLDESGENLVLASGAGEAGAQMKAKGLSIPLNREQSLVARAARERKGVTVNDVTQAPDFLPNPLLPDTRSELAVPMIVGGNVIGVFDVQSDTVGRFGDSDINIQTTLAAQMATSIQNVRSFEQAKAQADFESMVNTIGQKIQRATTVDDTLQTAIRELGLALGATRVKANIQTARQDIANDNKN